MGELVSKMEMYRNKEGVNSFGRPRGAVVIASPWPRSGSANIFEAQASCLANAGLEVALLVAPCDYWHNDSNYELLANVEEGFDWPSVELVSWASFGRNVKRAKVKGELRWFIAGRDSELKIQARMALDTFFTEEFKEFLLTHDVEVIYANHVFQLLLARKVAGFLAHHSGQRPDIVVETHDIQSELNTKAFRKNTFSKVPDRHYRLVQDEVSLLSKADKITHLSVRDMEFFSKRLPDKKHFLIPPTLSPETEKKLMSIRGAASSEKLIDFLWVGNNNPGNVRSLKWFFEHVAPLLDPGLIFYFLGTVRDYFKDNEPEIFEKYGAMFLGEVPEVVPFYEVTRAVIAPVIFGTGVSIKFVEALCLGKRIIATPLACRGLSRDHLAKLPLRTEATPVGFAKAMMEADKYSGDQELKYSQFYDEHLSNKRYNKQLLAATGLS